MKQLCRIFLLASVAIMTGCYDNAPEPTINASLPPATISIGDLRTLCNGHSATINSDVVIAGVVVSSDEEGNFYRTLYFDDTTGGAELLAGGYSLYARYPIGVKIAVKLNGCKIAFSDEVMQIGLVPESYSPYELNYFGSQVILDRHVVRGDNLTPPQPATIKITELKKGMCGRHVAIDNLTYSPENENESGNVGGYRCYADSDGNCVYSFVRDNAHFALMPTPTKLTSLRGILQYHHITGAGDCFVIKPSSSNDFVTED